MTRCGRASSPAFSIRCIALEPLEILDVRLHAIQRAIDVGCRCRYQGKLPHDIISGPLHSTTRRRGKHSCPRPSPPGINCQTRYASHRDDLVRKQDARGAFDHDDDRRASRYQPLANLYVVRYDPGPRHRRGCPVWARRKLRVRAWPTNSTRSSWM